MSKDFVVSFFSVEEMRCFDGTPYPAEWVDTKLARHFRVLNKIRVKWGAPLIITPKGGYRTEEFNRKHGGAPASRHVRGDATDIRLKKGDKRTPKQLHDMILAMYKAGEIPELGGLGEYPAGGFVHVDTRPGNRLARWTGSRAE